MAEPKLRMPLSDQERARFEQYALEIFARFGLADTEGTRATPRRWVGALWDMTEGYDGDPKLSTVFPIECPVCPPEERTHVVEGPIRFTALCEHHVLPIRGSVWVGYLPAEKLIGISKLTRISWVYAKRFTSQERLCHDIANELTRDTAPRGVAVYAEAQHFCTQARGVRESSTHTTTLVMRGAYNQNPLLAQEFRLMVDRRSGIAASES
jgi:GTP cyclohydrolase I